MSDTNLTLYDYIGGRTAIDTLVDNFYAKMQDDYRVNRFFNSTEQREQTDSLKILLTALLGGTTQTDEELNTLLDNFFLTAFARNKRKSFVGGSDFGFLGYISPQDHPSKQYLCESHSHLLKLMPDDFHYDVVMEHLTSSLQQLHLDDAVKNEVLLLAERVRNPVLGK